MESNSEGIFQMYVNDLMSIPDISKKTGVPRSTVRSRLAALGVLRGRADAIRLAAMSGKLANPMKGKTRSFTPEWRGRIAKARQDFASANAKGWSVKPNGYVEYTNGVHKGRMAHVVAMETHIGRRLLPSECVHHIDGDRSNNDLSNLQLMTRSEHSRHHGKRNHHNRERKSNGQFE